MNRPSIGDFLFAVFGHPQPVRAEPEPEPFSMPSSGGNSLGWFAGMTDCERIGIGGDAGDGCPLAGTDACTCDPA
jgi:hypothetical protein